MSSGTFGLMNLLAATLVMGPLTSQSQSIAIARLEKKSEQPVIRSTSSLVLLDVVVADHSRPVHGLERGQFHIYEDDKERSIVSFEEISSKTGTVHGTPVHVSSDLGSSRVFSNIPSRGYDSPINVILLDGLNTSIGDQANVRHQMLEFIERNRPSAPVAIFSLASHLRLLVRFTDNPEILREALTSSKSSPERSSLSDLTGDQLMDSAIGEMAGMGMVQVNEESNSTDAIAAMQQFEADQVAFQLDQRVLLTLNALRQLGRYLSGIPGRKNLIWFSGSFPISLDPDVAVPSPMSGVRNYLEQVRETAQLLSNARIAIYPIDAKGLLTPTSVNVTYAPSTNLVNGPSTSHRGNAKTRNQANRPSEAKDDAAQMKENMEEEATMDQVALATGGKAYFGTTDFPRALTEIFEDGSSFYTIGFVPSTTDGRFHRLKLKFDHGAYSLLYRSTFLADSTPTRTSDLDLTAVSAISICGAPISTEIPIEVQVRDSTDPALKDSVLPIGPAGELSATLSQPIARMMVDLNVDARGIISEGDNDHDHEGRLEFVLIAFDGLGHRINYLDKGFQLRVKADRFPVIEAKGIQTRLALDVPRGRGYLRLAVRDLVSNRIGSLELQYITKGDRTQ